MLGGVQCHVGHFFLGLSARVPRGHEELFCGVRLRHAPRQGMLTPSSTDQQDVDLPGIGESAKMNEFLGFVSGEKGEQVNWRDTQNVI